MTDTPSPISLTYTKLIPQILALSDKQKLFTLNVTGEPVTEIELCREWVDKDCSKTSHLRLYKASEDELVLSTSFEIKHTDKPELSAFQAGYTWKMKDESKNRMSCVNLVVLITQALLEKRGNYQFLVGPFLETRGRYPGVELSTHETLGDKPVDLITC